MRERAGDLVDLLVAWDPMVVAELVAHELSDQQRRRERHRQAQDADRAVEPVASEIAVGRDEIVAEHRTSPHRRDWTGL